MASLAMGVVTSETARLPLHAPQKTEHECACGDEGEGGMASLAMGVVTSETARLSLHAPQKTEHESACGEKWGGVAA